MSGEPTDGGGGGPETLRGPGSETGVESASGPEDDRDRQHDVADTDEEGMPPQVAAELAAAAGQQVDVLATVPDGVEAMKGERRRRRKRRRRDTIPGMQAPAGIRGRVARIVAEDNSDLRRRIRYPVYMLRVTMQVLRTWARDRCPQQAASLAFQTILSIVPMIAVALAILRSTDSMGAQSSLVKFLASQFIPVSPEIISEKLIEWSENITFESLGMIGLITTVILAFVMVNSLERIANQIWRAEKKRSYAQKFVVFYASATIGPFLLGAGLFQAAKFGLTEGFLGLGLSFITSYVALFLANYFLPACTVRPGPAAIGALVSTLLFEAAKFGFNVYVTAFAFDKYAGMYGAVAIAPLWLLWIYYSWLTMLLGFEVAHVAQNLHLLERVDRRGTMSLENEILYRVNGVVASRVMVEIVRAFKQGKKVLSRRSLETMFDLSDDVIERIAERLKAQDLIIEVEGEHNGYAPARPPGEITLAAVLGAFRGDDVIGDVPVTQRTRLDKVLTDIEADTLQRTANLHLDELV